MTPDVRAAPAPGPATTSPYPRWWVIVAAWTAWGLLWSAQVTVSSRLAGKPMPFDVALRIQMPLALAWALFTPGVTWLGRRVPPFGNRRWPLGVAVNLVSSMAVVFGLGVFYIVNTRAVQGVSPDAQPRRQNLQVLATADVSGYEEEARFQPVELEVGSAQRSTGSWSRPGANW